MKTLCLTALALVTGCGAAALAEAPAQRPQESAEVARKALQTPDTIPELMDAFGVSGMAVTAVAQDTVLLAQGYGETQSGEAFTSTTQCGLYSATKVLASLTYAKLDAQGRLDLNAPISAYLDDAPERWRAIPFYRLLNHTSGITMAVNKDAFEAVAADPNASNESIYAMIRDEPLDYQPGEYSRYRQSGYAIGEVILARELGEDFASLVEEHLVEPAGLVATTHPATQDRAQPAFMLSAGGYQTTAEDMARLFQAINDGIIVRPETWRSLILNEDFLFDDYSLGSVIDRKNGILTMGHSGGGARANIRYAPDQGVGVMVCTDDRSNNWLAMQLAQMLMTEIVTGEVPATPLQVALKGYADMTGAQVVAAYRKAQSEGDRYDFSAAEALLNEIGYEFLSQDRIADAVIVMKFYAGNFPTSANAHDSLGEALLTAGNTSGALDSYREVLRLDPGNANALKMIAGIENSQS